MAADEIPAKIGVLNLRNRELKGQMILEKVRIL
jgi:hypothetical protein